MFLPSGALLLFPVSPLVKKCSAALVDMFASFLLVLPNVLPFKLFPSFTTFGCSLHFSLSALVSLSHATRGISVWFGDVSWVKHMMICHSECATNWNLYYTWQLLGGQLWGGKSCLLSQAWERDWGCLCTKGHTSPQPHPGLWWSHHTQVLCPLPLCFLTSYIVVP